MSLWVQIGLGAAFIAATILATLAIQAGSRYAALRLFGAEAVERSHELGQSLTFRIASLHGLILALVFAQEMGDYSGLRSAVLAEATAVADIYNDIARYDPEGAAPVQAALAEYVRHVGQEEFSRPDRHPETFAQGWALRETVYLAVLDLEPGTVRQEALRGHMIEDAQRIATLRQQRENSTRAGIGALFWVAALGGTVLIAVSYATYPAGGAGRTLLALYAGYSGLVMFLILAFADPFSPPGQLAPHPFDRLVAAGLGAPDS